MPTWDEVRARTILADEHLLVLDKPAGVSVMGERHDDDLLTLAAAAGEPLRWVHRIDKVTSGVVLLARTAEAHAQLTRQFARRTVAKRYLAITASVGLSGEGTIELPLTTGRKNRVRIAADREAITHDGSGRWSVPDSTVRSGGRVVDAVTHYRVLGSSDTHTLLELEPVTGRRHQIRVHLAWIGHPIAGDPLFRTPGPGRCCLHARRLGFDHPDGRRLSLRSDPEADFWAVSPPLAVHAQSLA